MAAHGESMVLFGTEVQAMVTTVRHRLARRLPTIVAVLLAGAALWGPGARLARASPEETPREAALALLFAEDAATALRYLPRAFVAEAQALPEAQRQQILGNLLVVRGLEAAGAKVEKRQRDGRPEVLVTLPRGRGTIRVSLDKEVLDGARATLHCRAQRNDEAEEPFRARMILEERAWRLAGIRGSTEPDPSSLAAIWANLDNPRIAERMEAGERATNESVAIGDIRTLISAELAYAGASGGHFGPPTCLQSPATCLAGYTGPSMVAAPYPWTSPRRGYARTFHPGPVALDIKGPGPAASESRLTSFAIVAVPVEPGRTGSRGFCGDSTGRICVTTDGSAPPVKGGLCPSRCAELK